SAAQARAPGGVGVASWQTREPDEMPPYLIGDYACPDGTALTVALARSVYMGGREISPVITTLVTALRPRCLAMTGVCAGNPARAGLGDVVVPSDVYQFDEGKHTPDGFAASQRQIPTDYRLARMAQDLSTDDLPSFGAIGEHEAKHWLLEQLL